ncbi:hypothetical protein nvc1_037 [Namao virus]|nr:hypothetical protein nvc1_037 [Namao virus]
MSFVIFFFALLLIFIIFLLYKIKMLEGNFLKNIKSVYTKIKQILTNNEKTGFVEDEYCSQSVIHTFGKEQVRDLSFLNACEKKPEPSAAREKLSKLLPVKKKLTRSTSAPPMIYNCDASLKNINIPDF